MCNAINSALGVVLGQRARVGQPVHVIAYVSRTMDLAQQNYTTTEKELLAIVFALDKFRSYLLSSRIVVFSDHAALRYLLKKPDAKLRLIWWMFLLKEFNIENRDKKGVENSVADHLSRIQREEDLIDKLIFSCLNAHQITKANYSIVNPRSIFLKDIMCSISIDSSQHWPSCSRQKLSQYGLGRDLSDLVSAKCRTNTTEMDYLCLELEKQSALGMLMAIATGSSITILRNYAIATSSAVVRIQVDPSSMTITMVDSGGSPPIA
ncbi:Retrovirus-related Pol polyprotein, partial [Mucuna pruriens]